MIENGLIHMVSTRVAGTRLKGDHLSTATVLNVEDASDFDEGGGELRITYDDGTGVMTTAQVVYTTINADADTITLSAALGAATVDGDRIEVFPQIMEKIADVVLDGEGESIQVIIPHYLRDLIDEGPRDNASMEPVAVELVNGQWVLRDMLGYDPTIRSGDYVEGSSGFSLGPDEFQIANANVVGSMGAETVSGSSVYVGESGLWLPDGSEVGSRLDAIESGGSMPLGVIAYGTISSGGWTAGTTGSGLQGLDCNVYAGRVYRIRSFLPVFSTTTGTAYAAFSILYTTNGTLPTTASSGLAVSEAYLTGASHGNVPMLCEWVGTFASDCRLRLLTTIGVFAGGNPVRTFYGAASQHTIYVEDLGPGRVVDKGYANAGGGTATPPADEPTTYTRTYYPTWSQSYDGNNGKRDGDANTPDCYQGYYSATHGNTKSLVGYDSAAIRADLSGATISWITLAFRIKHSYFNAGLDVRIKDHNFSSAPTTYSAGSYIDGRDNCLEGSTYTITLPNSFATDLKNGNARGLGFYGPSTDRRYYGYMYGPGSGAAPTLKIRFSK